MPFSSAFTDKIGLVFRITLVKQIRTWYLLLLWWYYKILGHIFQRTLESKTCHNWTASKFASHAHKGVKWRRGLPFDSGTSCLSLMCKLVSVQYVRYENSLFTFQFIRSASQFPLFFARNSSLIWNASNPCHGHFFCFCFVFTPTPWKFQLSFILSLRKLCHVRPSFPLEFPMTLCEGVMDVFWNHTIQQSQLQQIALKNFHNKYLLQMFRQESYQ